MTSLPRRDRLLVVGGAAACAVCCAPPILALVGIAGAGTVVTLATLALAGLVVAVAVAAASVLAFVLRKRHRDRQLALRASADDHRALPDPVLRRGAR